MTIEDVGWDHPDAVALRGAQRAELTVIYGRDDSEPAGSEAVGPDMSVFLVGLVDGAPVACGGLRLLGDDSAEIKRMYAAPGVRGTGVATTLLHALESWGRERGLRALRLETGDQQFAAMRFYEREGYVPVPLFGPYVGSSLSRCYEKPLRPSDDGRDVTLAARPP